MGEGLREEIIVDSALGGGRDGVDSDFIGFGNPDGRHYVLSRFPLISNRLELFLNGSPLTREEASIEDGYDGGPIPDQYDYRVDLSNGRLILQNATLRNFGTTLAPINAQPRSTNRGTGFLSAPTYDSYGDIDGYLDNQVNLLDENANAEVWTLRAVANSQVSALGSTTLTAAQLIAALTTNAGSGILQLNHRNQVAATITITIDGGLPLSLAAFALDPDGFPVSIASTTGRLTVNSSVVTADVSGASYVVDYTYIDTVTSFTLSGSLSGLSRNPTTNAPLIWFSNGSVNNNGVLEFAVSESLGSGAVDFALNDTFSIQVNSRKLNPRDRLEARYIATLDINDVQLFDDLDQLFKKHGSPSTENTLSLGAQLAFENGAEQVYAIQPKPTISRRTTENLLKSGAIAGESGATGGIAASDLIFEITLGQPDGDTNVHLFSISDTNPNRSTQLFPQKIDFYNPAYGDDEATLELGWAEFISDNPLSAYTVVERIDSTTGATKTYLFLSTDLALSSGQGLYITFVDERDADFFDGGWADAFEELEKYDPYYVVPLPCKSFSLIQRNALEHAEKMSDIRHRKERVVLTGTPRGVTIDALLGLELLAFEDVGIIEGVQGDDQSELALGDDEDLQDLSVERNFGDTFRMLWAWPDELIRVVNGEQVALSGIYLGAAIAGLGSRQQNLAEPFTNKTLSGFTILRDKIATTQTMNLLGDAGVTVIEPVLGGGRIRFGLTTIQNGVPEEEEPSVVNIRDFVARALRVSLEERFVGVPFDITILGSAQVVVVNIMQSLISQGLVQQVADISVTRDPVEPRQMNVRLAFEPTFPLNWIFIDLSVGLL